MKTLYHNDRTVLVNFTKTYYQTADEILNGDNFRYVMDSYLSYLKENDVKVYRWVSKGCSQEEAVNRIINLAKQLYIISVDEIDSPLLRNRQNAKEFVENFYNYWRKMQRCTMIKTKDKAGLQIANFLDADNKYNQLIIDLYRRIEENVQGRKNNIYRQLNAGSDASMVVRKYHTALPEGYETLGEIPFINTLMLRTPLLLHPKCNKREGTFSEIYNNPVADFRPSKDEWFCYPARIGQLLCFMYFHVDYLFSNLALANLFEMALDTDCENKKPDLIVLFGNKDDKEEISYYHDKENEIWIGNVSYRWQIEYFGYLKKMALTVHNLSMMERGYLPIHGAMMEVTLQNGETKGIVFMGDSGAGKSETIEALQSIASDKIENMQVIFDDMGSLHEENGQVYAQGTEIGAFVRLDDLDKGSAYRDMDRSIFFNPETSNARVVLPVVPYSEVVANHKVDLFVYANNYDQKDGLGIFNHWEDCRDVCLEGKRFALGTTQEKGLSKTFFANPFGPMQQQKKCLGLVNQMFELMAENGTTLGEVYTHLGCADKSVEKLQIAAEAILQEINK